MCLVSATTQSHVWRDFPVAGAFTNLSRCGKVVSTKVGCGPNSTANIAECRQPSCEKRAR